MESLFRCFYNLLSLVILIVGDGRDLPPVREPARMGTIPGYMMPGRS